MKLDALTAAAEQLPFPSPLAFPAIETGLSFDAVLKHSTEQQASKKGGASSRLPDPTSFIKPSTQPEKVFQRPAVLETSEPSVETPVPTAETLPSSEAAPVEDPSVVQEGEQLEEEEEQPALGGDRLDDDFQSGMMNLMSSMPMVALRLPPPIEAPRKAPDAASMEVKATSGQTAPLQVADPETLATVTSTYAPTTGEHQAPTGDRLRFTTPAQNGDQPRATLSSPRIPAPMQAPAGMPVRAEVTQTTASATELQAVAGQPVTVDETGSSAAPSLETTKGGTSQSAQLQSPSMLRSAGQTPAMAQTTPGTRPELTSSRFTLPDGAMVEVVREQHLAAATGSAKAPLESTRPLPTQQTTVSPRTQTAVPEVAEKQSDSFAPSSSVRPQPWQQSTSTQRTAPLPRQVGERPLPVFEEAPAAQAQPPQSPLSSSAAASLQTELSQDPVDFAFQQLFATQQLNAGLSQARATRLTDSAGQRSERVKASEASATGKQEPSQALVSSGEVDSQAPLEPQRLTVGSAGRSGYESHAQEQHTFDAQSGQEQAAPLQSAAPVGSVPDESTAYPSELRISSAETMQTIGQTADTIQAPDQVEKQPAGAQSSLSEGLAPLQGMDTYRAQQLANAPQELTTDKPIHSMKDALDVVAEAGGLSEGHVKLAWKDEVLGHVRLEIRVENDQVQLKVWTEQQTTDQSMSDSRRQLESELERYKLHLKEFSMGNDARGHSERQAHSHNPGQREPGAARAAKYTVGSTSGSGAVRRESRLDVMA